MPTQSGDPISSALQASLSGRSSQKDDVTLLLSYSAKQILLSKIECIEYTYDSTSFLKELKSKYIVISDKDNEDGNKPSSSNSISITSKPKISVSNCSEPAKQVERNNTLVKKQIKANNQPTLPTPSRTLWPPDAVSLGWKPKSPVGGGFINLWNSCYINATLQALFHVPSFVNWLQTENSHKCPKKSNGAMECLICSMALTLKNSQESTGKSIKPCLIYSRLKSICKHLNPGTQEDAHEFLRHLVDSLDRTYLSSYKDLRLDHLSKETTPLSQIFGGYLRSEVVCQSCGYISTTFQYFQDLPLDIANSCYLDGALDNFFFKESVSELEGYKCENCKRKVPFTKKFSIEKAPRVLCLQLKRFGAVSGKNNKPFYISGKPDLNKYRANKTGSTFDSYELAAIINHIGTSTSCGHYTTIALAADRKFYLFDDQRVERLHDLSPSSAQAYILLYQQKPSNVPNGTKQAFNVQKFKMSNSNGKNTSAPQESVKERLFGKGDSSKSNPTSPLKLFNNVVTPVSNSVHSKVNGNGAGCSNSSKPGSSSDSNENCFNRGEPDSPNGSSVPDTFTNFTDKTDTSSKTFESPSKTDGSTHRNFEVTTAKSTTPVRNEVTTAKSTTPVRNEVTTAKSTTPVRNEVATKSNCVVRTINFEPATEKPKKHSTVEDSTTSTDSRLQNGHGSQHNNNKYNTNPKSLVPYNESSCSSEEGSVKEDESSQTPETSTEAGPPSKKIRFNIEKDLSNSNCVRTNGSTSSVKNGAGPSNRLNGHSYPGKQKYSNGNSSNGGQRYGKYPSKWMVTLRSPSTSPAKSEPTKNKIKIKGLDKVRKNRKFKLDNAIDSFRRNGVNIENSKEKNAHYYADRIKGLKKPGRYRLMKDTDWFEAFKEESEKWFVTNDKKMKNREMIPSTSNMTN